MPQFITIKLVRNNIIKNKLINVDIIKEIVSLDSVYDLKEGEDRLEKSIITFTDGSIAYVNDTYNELSKTLI